MDSANLIENSFQKQKVNNVIFQFWQILIQWSVFHTILRFEMIICKVMYNFVIFQNLIIHLILVCSEINAVKMIEFNWR